MFYQIKQNFEGFFSTLKQAIAGGERDYTTEKIGRAITLLAIPMVLEMLMESVFAVTDVFFVARLGIDAVAAVGMTEALISIVYAIAVGFAVATTGMVARRIGEKKDQEASVASVQAIFVGCIAAILIAIPGAIYAPELLRFMGGSPELIATGSGYTRFMLGGCLTIIQLFIINAIFRGAGDASLSMRVLWVANGINIVLDPCLLFGWGPFPEMGVTGAAVATNIGRGIGVLMQLALLIRGSGRIKVTRRELSLRWRIIGRLLRVSVGGIGQYLISTSSWVILMRVVGEFGATAVAGYTIAIRIIIFALMPSWGVAMAAATLVGQNLGAGKPERAEVSVWRTGFVNAAFLLVVTVIFVIWPENLIRIFTGEEQVVAVGVAALRIVSCGYIFYAFGMVMAQAFNGAGDTATPTKMNFFCYWLCQLPLAYLLAHHTALLVNGVFVSIMLAEVLLTITGILLFRKGEWKHQVI